MLTERMKELSLVLADSGCFARRVWQEQKTTAMPNPKARLADTMDFKICLDSELDERIVEGVGSRLGVRRFLTEEGVDIPERNQVFGERAVIDSLDGSSNFASGRPDFGISVEIEQNGEPLLAGIFAPVRGELIVAEKNQGLYLFSCFSKDLEEIRDMIAEGRAELATICSFSLPRREGFSLLHSSRVYVHTGKRRNFELAFRGSWNTIYSRLGNPASNFSSSVALIEVALGKLDGAAVGFQNYWDFAAGRLLVAEARGYFGVWDCGWIRLLTDRDLAEADATKDSQGNEWLAHILAAGNRELFQALEEHFTSPLL